MSVLNNLADYAGDAEEVSAGGAATGKRRRANAPKMKALAQNIGSLITMAGTGAVQSYRRKTLAGSERSL